MQSILSNLLLLAQRAQWERLGDRFQRQHSVDWNGLVLWGAVAVAFVVVMIFLSRRMNHKEENRETDDPLALFLSLCRVHGLNRPSRQLLTQLAVAHGLTQPATLFLEPDRFTKDRLPKSLQGKAKQLEMLCDQLFSREVGNPNHGHQYRARGVG